MNPFASERRRRAKKPSKEEVLFNAKTQRGKGREGYKFKRIVRITLCEHSRGLEAALRRQCADAAYGALGFGL
jgi:hypothetical protein